MAQSPLQDENRLHCGNKDRVLTRQAIKVRFCSSQNYWAIPAERAFGSHWVIFKFDPVSGIELFRRFSNQRLNIPRIWVSIVPHFPYLIKLMVWFFSPFLMLHLNSICSLCAFHLCASLRRVWLPLLYALTLGTEDSNPFSHQHKWTHFLSSPWYIHISPY